MPTPLPKTTDGMLDSVYHSGSVRMGRNKEISDDFTLREQAKVAMANARTSTKQGKMKPGNYSEGKITTPKLYS